MTDEQPKLTVVSDVTKGERNPTNVFDDLGTLRKQSKLTVKRQTVLVNVATDKPANDVYFRCHPDLALDDTTVVRDTEGSKRTFYYVVPSMRSHPKLAPRLRHVTLALTYIWPSSNLLIWPVPILGDRDFRVWKSARAAYELARERWTQMVWDEEKADYTIENAEGIDHEPVWPQKNFEDLLKLAFDGKVIDNEEHPYVRRLRGLLD